MDMRNSSLLRLKSDDGNCYGSVPPVNEVLTSLLRGSKAYIRVLDFLDAEVAERAYFELIEDPRYVRVDADAEKGRSARYRLGILKNIDRSLSPNVQMCFQLLTGIDFQIWLSQLIGYPLETVQPLRLFRLERGDRIVTHDDILDHPLNRISAVLHLSKNWKREFGGNIIFGEVERVENVRLGGNLGHRWVLSQSRTVLTPIFNSLIVNALRPGTAHAVSTVYAKAGRVSIAALYALKQKVATRNAPS